MKTFKSICMYEGEKVKQYTTAETKKAALTMLKNAGFKVKTIEEV